MIFQLSIIVSCFGPKYPDFSFPILNSFPLSFLLSFLHFSLSLISHFDPLQVQVRPHHLPPSSRDLQSHGRDESMSRMQEKLQRSKVRSKGETFFTGNNFTFIFQNPSFGARRKIIQFVGISEALNSTNLAALIPAADPQRWRTNNSNSSINHNHSNSIPTRQFSSRGFHSRTNTTRRNRKSCRQQSEGLGDCPRRAKEP